MAHVLHRGQANAPLRHGLVLRHLRLDDAARCLRPGGRRSASDVADPSGAHAAGRPGLRSSSPASDSRRPRACGCPHPRGECAERTVAPARRPHRAGGRWNGQQHDRVVPDHRHHGDIPHRRDLCRIVVIVEALPVDACRSWDPPGGLRLRTHLGAASGGGRARGGSEGASLRRPPGRRLRGRGGILRSVRSQGRPQGLRRRLHALQGTSGPGEGRSGQRTAVADRAHARGGGACALRHRPHSSYGRCVDRTIGARCVDRRAGDQCGRCR